MNFKLRTVGPGQADTLNSYLRMAACSKEGLHGPADLFRCLAIGLGSRLLIQQRDRHLRVKVPGDVRHCRKISQGVAYQRNTRFSFPFVFTTSSGTPHGR